MELGALGVSIEQFDVERSTETIRGFFSCDAPAPELERSIKTYLKAIECYFPSQENPQVSIRRLAEGDWQEKWRAFFRPVRVSPRIVIKPKWEPYEAGEKQVVVEIDPGMAFGTGLHATTRLCLNVMEREIDRRIAARPGKGAVGPSLLDVGTGSGILAITAAKLGAKPVVGIDIDETIIDVARKNVIQNGVEEVVRIGSENLEEIGGRFDLILANIDFRTLANLKGPLTGHVSQGGRLILSGITTRQKRNLSEVFRGEGIQIVKDKSREGWSCLVFERS